MPETLGRLTLYPLSPSSLALASYIRDRLASSARFVSPAAWGMSRNPDLEALLGYEVFDSLDPLRDGSDSLVLLPHPALLEDADLVEKAVTYCRRSSARLIALDRRLKRRWRDRLSSLGSLWVHDDHPYFRSADLHPNGDQRLAFVPLPVIQVVGLGEDVGKFDVQVLLRGELERRGHSIFHVSSRDRMRELGICEFPWQVFRRTYTDTQQVCMFSRFIAHIAAQYSPEAIILGVPGGCIPFDPRILNGFGVLHYKLLRALFPDIVICCVYQGDYSEQELAGLSAAIRSYLGRDVDAYVVTNGMLDPVKYEEAAALCTMKLIGHPAPNLPKSGTRAFSVQGDEGLRALADWVEETLCGHAAETCYSPVQGAC